MDIIFNELDTIRFMLKIILAVVCGFMIGIERELMGKPAGIKTHSLICLGSCLFTHFSISFGSGDPTRVAAQVVSGIGFIGAGTILQSKQRIEGLTSAALVFVNASVGMLLGGEYFFYAILSVMVILLLSQFIRTNAFQTKHRSYRVHIRCRCYSDIEDIIHRFDELQCNITQKKVEKLESELELSVTYLTTPLANHRILATLHELPSLKGFVQF